MTTLLEIYEEAVETLSSMEGHEAEVYEAYSGRSMYGKEVPAIVSTAPATLVGAAVFAAALNLYDGSEGEDEDYFAWAQVPMRSDDMGKSKIYY